MKQIQKIFKEHGEILKTSDAIKLGIHPETLRRLCRKGDIEQLGRGLYRWAKLSPLGHPDLVSVAMRVPKGAFCLISALFFHGITTQIPHEIYLAVSRNASIPRIDYPPVRIFRFSSTTFEEGIEHHKLDGVPIRVYSIEKTLADCFKYRNQIGLDVAIEALKSYRKKKRFQGDALVHFARICRVEKIMRPYLEALL
ncbi:MAG: type IV toxin-antitoxin system AbiEi family antitoxin domain-containing protein [Verrucomicrobiota bacterium]